MLCDTSKLILFWNFTQHFITGWIYVKWKRLIKNFNFKIEHCKDIARILQGYCKDIAKGYCKDIHKGWDLNADLKLFINYNQIDQELIDSDSGDFTSIYKFRLSVCFFVSNKRQNGWTDQPQILCGTSRGPREGLS